MLSLRHYLRPYRTIKQLLYVIDLMKTRIELQERFSGIEKTLQNASKAREMALESIVECQKMELEKANTFREQPISTYLN